MTYRGPLTTTVEAEDRLHWQDVADEPWPFRYDPLDDAERLAECVVCGNPGDERTMVPVSVGYAHPDGCAADWDATEGDET